MILIELLEFFKITFLEFWISKYFKSYEQKTLKRQNSFVGKMAKSPKLFEISTQNFNTIILSDFSKKCQ